MAASSGLVVHHLNNSRSQRVVWLLEELEVPYTIKKYERNKQTMRAPAELKAVHPLGKSPVITDNGVTIAESGFIAEYLVDKYGRGRLKPSDSADLLRYRFWMHHAEGSAMLPPMLNMFFSKIYSDSPFFIRPISGLISGAVQKSFIQPEIKSELAFVEGELGKSEWLAGSQLSAADILMSFPLQFLLAQSTGAWKFEVGSKTRAWLQRCEAEPKYKLALEKSEKLGIKYSLKF